MRPPTSNSRNAIHARDAVRKHLVFATRPRRGEAVWDHLVSVEVELGDQSARTSRRMGDPPTAIEDDQLRLERRAPTTWRRHETFRETDRDHGRRTYASHVRHIEGAHLRKRWR